jgi:rare lipoprotein A
MSHARLGPSRRVSRLVFGVGLLLLADCSKQGAASGPRESPQVEARVTRGGPANGCSAAELKQPARKVIEGLATYYADSLAGNRTANGERYDPGALSAAHLSLPFGTRLRVTRTDRRSSPIVCVRVNDRGPYGNPSHVLDLSRRAAERLRMIRSGVVPVKIEVL